MISHANITLNGLNKGGLHLNKEVLALKRYTTLSRLIVKFIQRDKSEELYKHRKNLVGKNISHLPSVEDGNGKIFINESLTSYRKRLFGRIREYKRNNNLKYLWTSNGKIMLKVNDTSPTQAFVTHEQFEDYLDQISNH